MSEIMPMNMGDAESGIGLWRSLPADRAEAFLSALMTGIMQAIRGECLECPCDVCVSLRGTYAGLLDAINTG